MADRNNRRARKLPPEGDPRRYFFSDLPRCPTCGSPKHEFSKNVRGVLANQHAVAPVDEQNSFIEHLSRSIRLRGIASKRWSKIQCTDDIIGLIQIARASNDLDEAIWRSFLAAHFGRASADESQTHSASTFLCAFGPEPYWTWKRVRKNAPSLRNWLSKHAADLQTLAYGNHRKYESKQAEDIWKVIESFLTLAEKNGGPLGLVAIDPTIKSSEQFDLLYRRLKAVFRFGRTGRFDFLVLLLDLSLISAEPASTYLRGATGPKAGAIGLWGKRPTGHLGYLADDLARQLGISPIAVEDALCNWQK